MTDQKSDCLQSRIRRGHTASLASCFGDAYNVVLLPSVGRSNEPEFTPVLPFTIHNKSLIKDDVITAIRLAQNLLSKLSRLQFGRHAIVQR